MRDEEFDYTLRARYNECDVVQAYALDMIDVLAEKVPKNVYCVLGTLHRSLLPFVAFISAVISHGIGITSLDIYESEDIDDGSYIMGRGTGDRAGVLSLYRFFPSGTLFDVSPASEKVTLRRECELRACKTMVHEVLHMFGVDHCVYHLCVMNANVSPYDDDADVIWLCPIDLAKLLLWCGSIDFFIDLNSCTVYRVM